MAEGILQTNRYGIILRSEDNNNNKEKKMSFKAKRQNGEFDQAK
jgi:hypothetical protein